MQKEQINPPFGYRICKNGEFVMEPKETAVIITCLKLKNLGLTWLEITKELDKITNQLRMKIEE